MAQVMESVKFDEAALGELEASFKGQIIRPSDAGYDDARSIWNAMIDRRPALIARCLGVADVVTCVNFAREQGLILSIKGGGHNISGLAVRRRLDARHVAHARRVGRPDRT